MEIVVALHQGVVPNERPNNNDRERVKNEEPVEEDQTK